VPGTRDNFAFLKPFFLNADSDSSNTIHVEDHGRTIQNPIQSEAGA
jgi:hypothetical protein